MDHEFIECPECGKDYFFNNEDLTKNACDTKEFTCDHCKTELNLGWFVKVEVELTYKVK